MFGLEENNFVVVIFYVEQFRGKIHNQLSFSPEEESQNYLSLYLLHFMYFVFSRPGEIDTGAKQL